MTELFFFFIYQNDYHIIFLLFTPDVNYALRKVVCILKPSKHIDHDVNTGKMKIKTVTTFKNFDMDFTLGQEFTEDLGPVDGRKCQVCGFFFLIALLIFILLSF